jgi:IS30 family transposase
MPAMLIEKNTISRKITDVISSLLRFKIKPLAAYKNKSRTVSHESVYSAIKHRKPILLQMGFLVFDLF